MTRINPFAATALLAAAALLAACGGKSDEPAPKAETQAAEPTPAPAPAASPAAPAEPAVPVEITEELVTAYVEYQKEAYRLVKEYVEKGRENLEKAQGDTMKTLQQIGAQEKYSKEVDDQLAEKRKALGLTPEKFDAVRQAAQHAANLRLLFNQMGGNEQLEKMAAQQKVSIAALPEDQRAAATAEAETMMKAFTDSRDLAEVRQKYGDQAADALLKHADELADLQKQFLQLAKK
jgi:hypothetical protein